MKNSLFLVFLVFTWITHASRNKRAAYVLPDGAELIVGDIRSSFECSRDGYYADQENNCQIFHVCHSVTNSDGTYKIFQWSFFCGNQTIFNQFSFTCAYPKDSIPCEKAKDFFYLNDAIGVPNLNFHNEMDIAKSEAMLGITQAGIPRSTAGVVPEELGEDSGTTESTRDIIVGEAPKRTSGHTGRAPQPVNRPDSTLPPDIQVTI